MTAISTQHTISSSAQTDAMFRAWGKSISDCLLNGGWIADGSTINWLTVAAPTTAAQIVGYEIYKSGDAGSGLNPIYIKLEYGANSGNANTPVVFITIGWGNSAGTITGNQIARFAAILNTSFTSGTYWSNLAAGAGWFAIVMFNGSSIPSLFSLERTLNDSLQPQNEFAFVACSGTTGTMAAKVQVCNQASGTYPQESDPAARMIVTPANAFQSGNFGVSYLQGCKGGFTNPLINVFGSTLAVAGAAQSTLPLTSYGVSRTYIMNQNIIFAASPVSQFCLTRFE